MSRGGRSVSRDAILNATVEVTAREGLEGASLGAIAREAGTSKPLVLYHFRTRKELLREMSTRVLDRIHKVMEACSRAGGAGLEDGAMRAVFAPENRSFYAALHGVKSLGSRDGQVGAQLRHTFDHLARSTARLLGDESPACLPRAHALVIGIQGYIDLWLYSGDPDPDRYLKGAALLTRAMLLADNTPPPGEPAAVDGPSEPVRGLTPSRPDSPALREPRPGGSLDVGTGGDALPRRPADPEPPSQSG